MEDPYWIGAQICAVIVNVNRAKGPKAEVEDFMPRVVAGHQRQTAAEMYAIFCAATSHLGSK